MKVLFGERRLTKLLVLGAVGSVGLMLAATASPASVTIQVGSLAVLSGSVTGTVSGFQPNAAVTVNGTSYLADASGVVALSGASLAGSAALTVGFVDSNGVSQTVSTALKDATTGATLSAAALLDAIPDVTAPVTLALDVASGSTATTTYGTTTSGTTTTGTTTTGTTTTGTTTTGTTTTGTTTTGTSTTGGSTSPSVNPAGARTLSDGSLSIPATSVGLPYRLMIKKVVLNPRVIRAHQQPISIRFRVADTRGNWVRNAAVYMRTLPLGGLSPVRTKRTTMSGWVSFAPRSGKTLKLRKGGRVNIFVRASTPGEPIIGGTSTRRLVSLRVSTHL